jgi:hypothetical protein
MADLHAALEAEGRDPATVRRTVGLGWDLSRPERIGSGSADALAGALDSYEALGVDDVIVSLQPADEPGLERIHRALEIRDR